jgi:hypothetical protein
MHNFRRCISEVFILLGRRQHSGKKDIKNRLRSPHMNVMHILVKINDTHSLLT